VGGQKVEICDFAKTDHGARLVNTFYPTNGPQTSKSAEFVSMNPPKQTYHYQHTRSTACDDVPPARTYTHVLRDGAVASEAISTSSPTASSTNYRKVAHSH